MADAKEIQVFDFFYNLLNNNKATLGLVYVGQERNENERYKYPHARIQFEGIGEEDFNQGYETNVLLTLVFKVVLRVRDATYSDRDALALTTLVRNYIHTQKTTMALSGVYERSLRFLQIAVTASDNGKDITVELPFAIDMLFNPEVGS